MWKRLLSEKRLQPLLPPNISAGTTRAAIIGSLALGVLISGVDFMVRYGNVWDAIQTAKRIGHILPVYANVQMPPFLRMVDTTLVVFGILIVLALAFSALCYASFYQGSRSIYLMRRMPDGPATLRRWIWTVPLRWALLNLAMVLVLLTIFFLVWRFKTPMEYLPWNGDSLMWI